MPVPEQRNAVERHLLRDTAYGALCDAIVCGELAPGESLHDQELCAWLGISRTPVRDALARLAEEGLVELAPQRYTRVAPMTVQDARDMLPVVATVHALATELAVPQLERDDVKRLAGESEAFWHALRSEDGPAAWEADDRFHGVFVDVAGNAELTRVVKVLSPRLRRLERLGTATLPGRRAVAQHQAIVARAASGDARGAASATRENWLSLGAMLERHLGARDA
jgi:DNA-binding GntR family transcriptional regulator